MTILDKCTLALTLIMIGVELSVSLFINPALWKRNERILTSDLAGTLGRVMPIWYAVCLLFLTAEAILHRHESTAYGFITAAVVWLLTIVYTLALLVPINNRLAKDTGAPDFDWKTQHIRWDLLHRWRIVFLSASLLIFLRALR